MIDQFIAIVDANRSMGDLLSVAYERAERVHEAPEICSKRRFYERLSNSGFIKCVANGSWGRLSGQRGRQRAVAKAHPDTDALN